MLADDGAEYPELQADLPSPAQHISRLDRLIADQADELAALSATLREITALCDLAEWAGGSAGPTAVVRVDELRRAMTAPRRTATPGS